MSSRMRSHHDLEIDETHGASAMQAGTYIKEFVHGDEGRTEPNLGSFLGCKEPAAILQLDVLEIHMDFL